MSEMVDTILHGDSGTVKGMGATVFIDGLIVIIVAIIDMVNKHTFASMDSTLCGTLMIVFGALTAASGVIMIKFENKKIGWILGFAVSAVLLVLGILMTFNIIKNDLVFDIFYLIAGVINTVMLLLPKIRAEVF